MRILQTKRITIGNPVPKADNLKKPEAKMERKKAGCEAQPKKFSFLSYKLQVFIF